MLVSVLRPLTGEPLPLDLLNTTWIAGATVHDLLADEAGTRAWLHEHGFDAPADEPARHALVQTRETLRALLLARTAGAPRPAGGDEPASRDRAVVPRPAGEDGPTSDELPRGGAGTPWPARDVPPTTIAGDPVGDAPGARAAVEAVNAILARGGRHPLLTPDGLQYEVVAANAWRVPWRCAAELVELLDRRGDRVRGCANPDCVLWFLDTTRPGTRRWCSMAGCGNRDKAIRHGRVRRP
jgi:predicted RNA-binding Zn ribbon-like protein